MATVIPSTPAVTDQLGRPIRDLRISLTDRCNFRCVYCMPKAIFGPGFQFLERSELLSFEEIQRIVVIFRRLGIEKVRLTGGEPLLRRGLEHLVAMLRTVPGLDLTLTTNGSLLARKAQALQEAGLDRVTISLDSLDDRIFKTMNDVDFRVDRVLDGIHAAAEVGLTPIKINVVVKRGVNDDSIVPLVKYFRGTGHIVRFIEYMDVGTTNGWCLDHVVTADEIVDRIGNDFPLEPVPPNYPGEVASRYRFEDGGGEIGVIASVTRPFCGDCSRMRLSTEGRLYTCLFASTGLDLRRILREGASDAEIEGVIAGMWLSRSDRYSELRTAGNRTEKIEMSYIGG